MNLKQMVGIEAAKQIKNGMIVGLGTGSTAYYMVEELGRRIQSEGLEITGVTTSKQTALQAEALGIPLKSIDEVPYVDLTIDGADEISQHWQGIKGGGAALLFEKIVATYSKEIIWIVDDSKMVTELGAFPLPVEVVPYGAYQLVQKWQAAGYQPVLRKDAKETPIQTDNHNWIIDLHLERIPDPFALATELKTTVGVVEHGLFLNLVTTVIVGHPEGVRTYNVR